MNLLACIVMNFCFVALLGLLFVPSCYDALPGCPERALDTHIYQAWNDPNSRYSFYSDACQQKARIASMENAFGPVIVGEWSLATDNCAMWLNGFNDNLPGFPRLPCKYIECSVPYTGKGQIPGTPVDPAKPLQGPFGTVRILQNCWEYFALLHEFTNCLWHYYVFFYMCIHRAHRVLFLAVVPWIAIG